ncbi:MAG TPA: hypothetical protein VKE22_00920 [Haliangiales bacterium]|nr:hypothetical protein [Haliangiales bacterium]
MPFVLGVVAVGCGLISSDVTNISLALPPQDFRIDSSDWRMPPGATPIIPCAGDCSALSAAVCTQQNCSVACGSDSVCYAKVTISLKNDFDLARDAPSYHQVSTLPAVSVTVQSVTFDISENTLNLATPSLSVYFGPTSITGPNDPGAELVGTIPAVPAGQTGHFPVAFSSNGPDIVKKYMDDFHTPFRAIIFGVVIVHGGQASPTGRMVGQVNAIAKASLSL